VYPDKFVVRQNILNSTNGAFYEKVPLAGEVNPYVIFPAFDVLDFIDRDKGIADLMAGTSFRSKLGSLLTYDKAWLS